MTSFGVKPLNEDSLDAVYLYPDVPRRKSRDFGD